MADDMKNRIAAEGRQEAAGRVREVRTDGNGGVRRVAVYGTLMRGQPNERWREGVPTVASGTMQGRLYDTGCGFPHFVPDPHGDPVVCEVLETDADGIARMDVLEGCPRLYTRQPITVAARRNGRVETISAEVYVMVEARRPNAERRIRPSSETGLADWRVHRRMGG